MFYVFCKDIFIQFIVFIYNYQKNEILSFFSTKLPALFGNQSRDQPSTFSLTSLRTV